MADANGLVAGQPGYNPATEAGHIAAQPAATAAPVSTTPGGNGSEATTPSPAFAATPASPDAGTARTASTGALPVNPLTGAVGPGAITASTATSAFPTSGVGYNGNTGAQAHYDPASGMWIDTNGQMIRPDAIQMAPPTTASGGSSGAALAGAAAPDFNAQVRAMILQGLTAAGQPVDPNSPQIAATMSAAQDQASRSADAERTALAERLYASGGNQGVNTDALTRQIQQSGEANASSLSTLKAQLITNEYNQKLNTMQQDLQLAVQAGDTQSAQAIQVQIANLQAAVQREQIGANLGEFGAQLSQNAALAGLAG